MSVPQPVGTPTERARWSRTGRRVVQIVVAIVVISVVISAVTVPFLDRTRDARYETVSSTQELWIHRDARFDSAFRMQYQTGFWCTYYEWATVTLVEREGLSGGWYRVTFTYPTYTGQAVTVSLGAYQTEVVTSDQICSTAPGSVTITYSLEAHPPRVYEKYSGVEGNNTDWELKEKLTLRELEGTGGEYVVLFRLEPQGQDTKTVRAEVFPNAVHDFDVSFDVPTGTCCTISHGINAPKVTEKASVIRMLFG